MNRKERRTQASIQRRINRTIRKRMSKLMREYDCSLEELRDILVAIEGGCDISRSDICLVFDCDHHPTIHCILSPGWTATAPEDELPPGYGSTAVEALRGLLTPLADEFPKGAFPHILDHERTPGNHQTSEP